MAEVGCIRRVETDCDVQPVLYEWPSAHTPEHTAAVAVDRWPGQPEVYGLYGGCDDESPDIYATLDEALDALWRMGPADLCWACDDEGCPQCPEVARG